MLHTSNHLKIHKSHNIHKSPQIHETTQNHMNQHEPRHQLQPMIMYKPPQLKPKEEIKLTHAQRTKNLTLGWKCQDP
ncbi:hypothetical protein Dimus_038088 [Dionaea muscipula]